MYNKEFISGIIKCINDQCNEKCFMYNEDINCQYKLLDMILNKLDILPEDYKDWLEHQIQANK